MRRVLALLAAALTISCSSPSGSAAATATSPPPAPSEMPPATQISPSASPAAIATATPPAGLPFTSSHWRWIQPPGVAEPDSQITPGAADPQAHAGGGGPNDICVSGYASAHRHVVHQQYLDVYAAYGVPYPPPGYDPYDLNRTSSELDHLVPLELGGLNDDTNLWVQPATPPGFHQKDALENALRSLVCGGQLDLKAAQQAIATDWYGAYRRYVAGD